MLRQILKRGIERALQWTGYAIVPEWACGSHAQARYLQRLCKLMEIDCILDIGGNRGQYGRFLRDRVGYRGLIISFEPIPENASAIAAQAGNDELWVVKQFALGSHAGSATFNVMQDTVFSSFLDPGRARGNQYFVDNKIARRIEVEVHTLDALMDDLRSTFGFKHPYLKLDTQGFDLEVLRGAVGSLAGIRALQTEASVQPIYEGMPDYRAVIAHLNELGYEIGEMFSVNQYGFPFAVEFDCHMVSRQLFERLRPAP